MSLLERFARGLLPPLAEDDTELLAESEERGAAASRIAMAEYGRFAPLAGPELPATHWLPDPYGPDPVVFGHVPRVRGN